MADATYDIRFTQTGAEQVSSAFGKAGNSAATMAKSFAVAASALLAAKGLVSGITKAAELAGIQEEAEKKLAFALKGSAKALLDQASALQRSSTFGDEAIISQQAFLASIGKTESEIRKLIPAALDMSAATGMSLESAVRNLSKTTSGLAGELGELVPQVRSLTAEELKQGKAIEVVSNLFSGQAAAAADTYAGRQKQVENAIGDAAERIGSFFAPALEKAQRLVIQLADSVVNFNKSLSVIEPDNYIGRIAVLQNISIQTAEALRNSTEPQLMAVSKAFATAAENAGKEKGKYEELAKLYEQLAVSMRKVNDEQERDQKIKEDLVPLQLRSVHGFDLGTNSIKMHVAAVQELITPEQEAEMAKAATLQLISSTPGKLATANAAFKGNAELTKRLSQSQAVIDTYAAANAAYKAMAGIPIIGPALGAAAAALAIATGLGNVAQIQSQRFATGGSFVTDGPMTIASGNSRYIVGDNPGGRERVDVTPLSSANRNGPRAATFQLIFNGPITNEQYVRDVIAPAVRDAARSA